MDRLDHLNKMRVESFLGDEESWGLTADSEGCWEAEEAGHPDNLNSSAILQHCFSTSSISSWHLGMAWERVSTQIWMWPVPMRKLCNLGHRVRLGREAEEAEWSPELWQWWETAGAHVPMRMRNLSSRNETTRGCGRRESGISGLIKPLEVIMNTTWEPTCPDSAENQIWY